MATTGERLVELSTLTTGTAMDHFLNISDDIVNKPVNGKCYYGFIPYTVKYIGRSSNAIKYVKSKSVDIKYTENKNIPIKLVIPKKLIIRYIGQRKIKIN